MSYQGIIIAAKGTMNRGKTTAVLGVWEWLKSQGAQSIREPKKEYQNEKPVDVNEILEYQGILIGISSKGDPGIDQEKILDDFIQAKCRIIVCACRTKLSTKEPIDALRETWSVRYFDPAEDGFIPQEAFLDAVKKAIHEVNEKKIMRTVWKVGSRWDEDGSSEAKIADIFERYNVAFAYTDGFLCTNPGDLVAIGDGERVIAVGIILSPAMSLNQLNIPFSEEDNERIESNDATQNRGCIVRYHWFKDYSWLPNENLKKRMKYFPCTMGRFFHAYAIADEANEIFRELERIGKQLEDEWAD
ncbi:MAG: hypothetical protein J5944_14885 [Lentisphaeria bacterium]|nr:hypothetical protein [Lentisphaeria bacterium]